jgi:hypothetical protein
MDVGPCDIGVMEGLKGMWRSHVTCLQGLAIYRI